MNKLFFFLIFSWKLLAEVQEVVLTWNPVPCTNNCPKNLEERLQKAQGVVQVQMHAEEGRAVMGWDKKIPFSFVPLNWALRYVGVREKSLRVRVRGYIKGSGKTYSITSIGDNTVFVLFNRAQTTNPPQYVNLYNPTNRVLSPDQIAKLEEIKQSKQVAIIEGPIFMPERSPPDPLSLVLDNISVEPPSKTGK